MCPYLVCNATIEDCILNSEMCEGGLAAWVEDFDEDYHYHYRHWPSLLLNDTNGVDE